MGRPLKKTARLISGLLVIGLWSGAAFAAPIPAEALAAEGAKCRNDCISRNKEAVCEVLCACAMKQTNAFFDYEGFLVFKEEINSGAVSAANQNFSARTGLICAAELEREFGGR